MAQDRAGVFGGVDTHKHVHVAAAIDAVGRLLGAAAFDADTAGYGRLLEWLRSHGSVALVGVEGTGSYGAGLARHLAAAGVEVNRQTRRHRGKIDTVDAEAATRAALCGDADAQPKSADGPVEAIRMLSATRRSAVNARTSATNQITSLAVTAPERPKDRLHRLSAAGTVEACARLRPDTSPDPVTAAAKTALRAQGKSHREILRCLKRHIAREIYRLLTDPPEVPNGADLRRQRTRHGLTIDAAAQALNTWPARISELETGKRHNRDLAQRYQQHLTHLTT